MTSPSNDNATTAGKDACPICASPAVAEYAPFCSRRCADVDLHRWLKEGYAIPAKEDDSDSHSDRNEDT